jgi:hypothetical protein
MIASSTKPFSTINSFRSLQQPNHTLHCTPTEVKAGSQNKNPEMPWDFLDVRGLTDQSTTRRTRPVGRQ